MVSKTARDFKPVLIRYPSWSQTVRRASSKNQKNLKYKVRCLVICLKHNT
nr:MAG TPA: hypothetical protein [Caudoviricetes sp.]